MGYEGNTVTIPFGQHGIMTDMNPTDLPPNSLLLANDVILNPGYIEKAPGSMKYNTSTLNNETIVAGFDWWPTTISQRLIVATNAGSIYRDIGDRGFSLGVAIKTGLSGLTNQSMFIEGGKELTGRSKKLFYISANNQVQVLEADGTTFSVIDSPAADWVTPNFPRCGVIHRNRLWLFMGQGSYASNTGDHENFTSSTLIDNIYPGEGGDIIKATVYKGRLFVFKEGGFVYYLDDSSTDTSEWFFRKLDTGISTASSHSMYQVVNDLVVGTSAGSLVSLVAAQSLGDIKSADIYSQVKCEQFIRNNTSASGFESMHSLYYEEKKQAYFTYRTKFNTQNDAFVTLDMSSQTPRILFNKRDRPSCFFLRKDINKVSRPCYGAADGFVYFMDRPDRDVGGSAFDSEFQTPHIDFRHIDPNLAGKKKIFDNFKMEFIETGSWNIYADIFIDGDLTETLTIPCSNRNHNLDSFVLDSDELSAEETQRSVEQPLHGSGRTFSVKFRNSGLQQNFKIASFTVGFRVGAEDAARLANGPS